MSFHSVTEMLDAMQPGQSLADTILKSDLAESRITEEQSRSHILHLWKIMQDTSLHYDPDCRSACGLTGGDGGKMLDALGNQKLLGGGYLNHVIAEALKTSECNACMKRIVASPTAGSCGVLPAVLLPLRGQYSDEQFCDALYVSAGFGQVIASRATLAGAEGGCQAEVGSASAMAAAALVQLGGGTPDQCSHAAAMALSGLLGLACDPVAGLVEIPCVKRNVTGAVNAVACANMALAGITFQIPCDEVIDAMGRIGRQMSVDLRETAQGGLAQTPTGRAIAAKIAEQNL